LRSSAGDGALQAADGYFRILGRVDDVINVAGHRLGTKELESASLIVAEVAEATAVAVIDEVRGRVAEMYVALKLGQRPDTAIERRVAEAIDHEIGKIARPKHVWIVPGMPKTRSGKIMRRVIAAASNFATAPCSSSTSGTPTSATCPPWPTRRSSTTSAARCRATRGQPHVVIELVVPLASRHRRRTTTGRRGTNRRSTRSRGG
jgi:hypothetical protein